MGNRIGVIFHDNWKEFSPLLYSHFGADSIPLQLQEYLRNYYENMSRLDNDGHKYNPCHMLVGFLQSIKKDIHIRIENLDKDQIESILFNKEYKNCFEGDCWIINVSRDYFGINTTCRNNILYNNNENIKVEDLFNLSYGMV